MANRSHLYATDFIPPRTKGQRGPRGLNEHKSEIPFVHRLMIAKEPRVVHSEIWPDHEIAVIAERDGADARALAFFDRVLAEPFEQRDAFAEEVGRMREFLAKEEARRYVLLEPGEIFELEGPSESPKAWMERELRASVALNARVDRALAGQDDGLLAELRADPENTLGMGWWSHVLYFSFNDSGES